ncbi:MAG: GTP cyclohydrolase I FolE [Chitinophagales bacterium]|nr:GTP cyclohydrolase I FolE [Chitinophagales bacterium]MDW8428308.1 GTP cyclohydrolase I FolE [Chitinophagales bacterium]
MDTIRYKKSEHFDDHHISRLQTNYEEILLAIGENPQREGLEKSPLRAARALSFLTQGYQMDAEAILRSAMFQEEYKEMVIIKDIEMYSLCEHHLLPFFGRAHVAYIPDRYICGLSKICRVVDAFSRRLQVQERLTLQIRDCLQNVLKPLGVAVVIEAKHLCMMMRGVQKQNSVATTSAFTGEFEKESTRGEFLRLIAADTLA